MNRNAAVEAVFKPVRPPTTFEETVERLGTAIRVGLLTPGSRLPPERKLADELRISRSTLRQALTTLVQSGHLTSTRGRKGGTFVVERPPLHERAEGPAELGDPLGPDGYAILDHRVAVEAGAVILAAERAQRTDLDALDALVQTMAAKPDFAAYRRADSRFHISVAEAARSAWLVTEMTDVQGQMGQLIARIAHPEEVLMRANDQHRELVRLLRMRDAEGAVSVIRRHTRGTEQILAGLV